MWFGKAKGVLSCVSKTFKPFPVSQCACNSSTECTIACTPSLVDWPRPLNGWYELPLCRSGVPTLNANLLHIVVQDTTPLPHTTALSSSEDVATTHSGDMFRRSTGTSFRIRRTILLPSLPRSEAAERGESPAAISPGGRSTGLLCRYGETHQE